MAQWRAVKSSSAMVYEGNWFNSKFTDFPAVKFVERMFTLNSWKTSWQLSFLERVSFKKKSKNIFNVHWPNNLGLFEGFCTVCEQPWMDLNPRTFAFESDNTNHCATEATHKPYSWALRIACQRVSIPQNPTTHLVTLTKKTNKCRTNVQAHKHFRCQIHLLKIE